MAKYKLQEMPDVHHSGQKRVYPKLVAYKQMGTKEFIERMRYHNHAIPESVVKAVLTDAADFLGEMLAMGYTVKLDGLGSYSLSLGFEDDKPREILSEDDKMLHRKVTVKDVNYRADLELVKYLKRKTELVRDMGGVSRLHEQKYSLQERIARAQEWLKSHAFFTLQDYADLNNMSRTSASQELKQLTHGDEAPFGYTGRSSHKVWVKKG